jgi:ABC-type molybdate transport system substrate-binding protein
VRVAAAVHPTLHRPIAYPLALATHPVDAEQARALAAYLLGTEAREVLRRRGFRAE